MPMGAAILSTSMGACLLLYALITLYEKEHRH